MTALCWPAGSMGGDTTVKSSISAELIYDSNARIVAENQKRSEDYIASLSPQIEALNERKNLRLNGLYGITGLSYFKNPKLNTINHHANLGMKAVLSQKTSFEATEAIAYTKESLQAILIGIQTGRTGIWNNTISLDLNHEFTPRTSVAVNLTDNMVDFEDPKDIDARTDSARIGGTLKMTPNTSLTTNYSFTNISFRGSKKIENHTLQIGLVHSLSPSTYLRLSGGAVYTPIFKDRYDWIASAGLEKTFQTASLRIGYKRATSNSSGLTDQLNINDQYFLSWNQKLATSFDIIISGGYSKNKTKPIATVDIASYEAGIVGLWHPNQRITVSAGYRHFQQWSHGPVGMDTIRHLILLRLTATPEEWRF